MTNQKLTLDENRRIVQEGLNRRKLERMKRERQLDSFEDQMICAVNANCEAAMIDRRMSDTIRLEDALSRARIKARAKQRAKAERIRKNAALAYLSMFSATVVAAKLAQLTILPLYAALALIAGMVLFTTAYLADLYGIVSVEIVD